MAEATGEVEKEDHVLVIKRINVTLKIATAGTNRETVERVFGFFADKCPVYRTLKPAIGFQLRLELVEQ